MSITIFDVLQEIKKNNPAITVKKTQRFVLLIGSTAMNILQYRGLQVSYSHSNSSGSVRYETRR